MVRFDPLSPAFLDDPYDVYRALRDEAPVHHDAEHGFWALSRFEDVAIAHRDWRTFSSRRGVTLDELRRPAGRGACSIVHLDPPEHERMRNLVGTAFTPRAIAALEPMIHQVVRASLDRLAGASRFDAVADFAAPFPVEVVCTMLGVPPKDRPAVRRRAEAMQHGAADDPTGPSEAATAQTRYFMALVAAKRRVPGDDMLSRLCAAALPADDGTQRLSDREIASLAALLGVTGSATVTRLVGNGVVLFDRWPAAWATVVQEPGVLPNAVDEILRYWPPSQYQGRCTTAPATFHGVTIPAGVPVLLLTGSATRDERVYREPDRFDVRRRERHPALAFGYGVHACPGAALARMASRIAFDELRIRHPRFRVDPGGLRRVRASNGVGFSHVPIRV